MFIEDRNDLANKLKISLKELTYVLYKIEPQNCYSSFKIGEKCGTLRQINAP